ncbi:BlaR1 family beta-lactam sensor/signal transducer [Lacrimispora sp. JR3]|uniref:BlaR1 family beta-lactam sensor/signal transducer n=1 Tax=Lacrimispora sinapis TaxID=3111456 RepID=UPI0037492527
MIHLLMVRLLLNSMAVPFLFFALLGVRKFLGSHLTKRTQYNLWFLFLFSLAIPFLPYSDLCTKAGAALLHTLSGLFPHAQEVSKTAVQPALLPRNNLLLDFSVSVSRRTPSALPTVLMSIWIAGMVFMTGITAWSSHKVNQLKNASLLLQNKRIRELFDACLKESGIKGNIPIYSSAYVKSPLAIGAFKPVIIVPIHILSEMEEKDIRYILLHELSHCRHKDLVVNRLMALAQIVYWFHPVVWLAFHEMQNDREIACDASVLSMLRPDDYLDYGNTLINFAESLSRFPYSAAGMGGSKKEMRKRIISIAGFHAETKWCKRKSRLVFAAASVLAAGLMPAFSAMASPDAAYGFNAEGINNLEVGSCFSGLKGSFVLYELNSGQYSIYNEEEGIKRISPDSTYKIYSALAALEEGVITPDSSAMDWNGKYYPFDAWNRNQDLKSAMSHSVNWYFTSLDEKTGLSSLNKYFHKIRYGNSDLSGGLGRYWSQSSLKISPVEQVELLARFCLGGLPFAAENIKAVKDSLLVSSSGGSMLYGKTGTGNIDGNYVNGWFVGFVEAREETYVFATNIQDKTSANGSTAAKITLDILDNQNIYKK